MNTWSYHLTVKSNKEINIKDYLSKKLLIPKHLIYSLRKDKRILVNQKYLPMNFNIKNSDKLSLKFQDSDFNLPIQNILPDESRTIPIVYENDDLIVVNKPKGIKTHPNYKFEKGTLLNFIEAYLNQKNQHAYMIHRLDKETSGLIIIGKNPAVVPILIRLIKDKAIKRCYLAWVEGVVTKKRGVINQPIGLDSRDPRKRKINGANAKNALTKYKVITTKNNKSLLALELETGRTHQIRVHLSSIHHPIIGDPLYNSNKYDCRMFLHAWKLKLILPFSMKSISIKNEIK
ncbi:RluA family pseudouridine synthase [Apilactobacillus xinyiensis]|uniref:Pseudouridine synthase n=1 Tax=Apilactobacillus xinyiensis TaxID=2841032 RepID=A0ABT0I2M2_9LACO|nr:RluA family pseudouridine synthase [Apilactobacillus xinyiensis]MCK8624956.1 RluA family pseudouridine synthase [Apilactobacillus xinyiensis]MCL0318975.1 RluA family pseudouridine synthase [Apilactobacillus xinyiensis]